MQVSARIYMCVCLCLFCFHNFASLRVHNGLTTRNVEHRLVKEYLFVCLCVSYFCTSVSLHAHNDSLEEMYNVCFRGVVECVVPLLNGAAQPNTLGREGDGDDESPMKRLHNRSKTN